MVAHCSPFGRCRDDCKPQRLLVRFLRYSRGMKKGLWLDVSLGASYGLDVYAAASAAVGVLSSSECSPVESRFEFLAVLFLHSSTVMPYFFWILSRYHSGMTLNEQKGMILMSGVR